ncbi:glutamate 5-kinase [Candidatus Woesearchaeota archaeon]|nr:glutamate 5-kinase [Candidatus Woesearchaeota archaeon]
MRNFSGAKRVVVKVGTNILTKNKGIDTGYIKSIAAQLGSLVRKSRECILVSSGAIGFGSMQLGIKKASRNIRMKQSLAAVGQRILMNEYAKAFAKQHIEIAQILMTYDVISERKTFLNLRSCIEKLLSMGVVPIINENDVISIDEIGTRFGDNDRLSALVASKIDADLLILLTDIDGLYDDNPKKNDKAGKLSIIEKITPRIKRYAGRSGSLFAVGGMHTKIDAAKIAMDAGCSTIIADGRQQKVLPRIMGGEEIGTLFLAKGKLSSKKRWILNAKPSGRIRVNKLAEEVLKKGKSSLLPIGIEKVEGNFSKGDVVRLNDFAQAVADLDSKDMDKVKGMKSSRACRILGKKCRDEVIRKENIVFIRKL